MVKTNIASNKKKKTENENKQTKRKFFKSQRRNKQNVITGFRKEQKVL